MQKSKALNMVQKIGICGSFWSLLKGQTGRSLRENELAGHVAVDKDQP
jgi:hypothetical protein